VDLLPTPWRGFMMAGFAAAYMSTVGTQLNWGASYLVNDFYKRFLNKTDTEKHYVAISRWATVFLFLASAVVTHYLGTIEGAWKFLLALGSGTGLVLILRWYWWRINAWSEVSAMASAFVVSIVLRALGQSVPALDTNTPAGFGLVLITTTAVTTVVWLATTLLTSPERDDVLRKFYLRVRPGGPGWKPLERATGVAGAKGEIARNLWFWLLGVVFVYSIMFTTGALLFDLPRQLMIFGAALVVSGVLLFIGLSREPAPEKGIEEAA
jgi:hypothetical protein